MWLARLRLESTMVSSTTRTGAALATLAPRPWSSLGRVVSILATTPATSCLTACTTSPAPSAPPTAWPTPPPWTLGPLTTISGLLQPVSRVITSNNNSGQQWQTQAGAWCSTVWWCSPHHEESRCHPSPAPWHCSIPSSGSSSSVPDPWISSSCWTSSSHQPQHRLGSSSWWQETQSWWDDGELHVSLHLWTTVSWHWESELQQLQWRGTAHSRVQQQLCSCCWQGRSQEEEGSSQQCQQHQQHEQHEQRAECQWWWWWWPGESQGQKIRQQCSGEDEDTRHQRRLERAWPGLHDAEASEEWQTPDQAWCPQPRGGGDQQLGVSGQRTKLEPQLRVSKARQSKHDHAQSSSKPT